MVTAESPLQMCHTRDVDSVWCMAAFPSVDLTDLDLAPTVRTVRRLGERSVGLAKDATYTAVGLGLLTFQRAQVRRREFERSLKTG